MIIAVLVLLTVLIFVFDMVFLMKWDTIMRMYRKRLRSRYKPFEYDGIVCDKCKEPGRIITREVSNNLKICEHVTEYNVFFKYYGNRVHINNKELYDQVRIGDKIKFLLCKYKNKKIKILYFETENNRPPE